MNNLAINTYPTDSKESSATTAFSKIIPGSGVLKLRYLDIETDLPVIYEWVTQEYARYWGMNGKSFEEVKAEYFRIATSGHAEAFVGFFNGDMAFLCECYDPEKDTVGAFYPVEPGDRGMHILVSPPEKRIPNFTWNVFTTVMDFLFSDNTVERVVVEPDVNNEKIHALNRRAGFKYVKEIRLPQKMAALAFCTRSQYEAAIEMENNRTLGVRVLDPQKAVEHLQPSVWEEVNRQHLCKAISEFAHEKLVHPKLEKHENGWGYYSITPEDNTEVAYQFRAQILKLDHWYIDSASIIKIHNGKAEPLDSLKFILEFKRQLGIREEQLPAYLEEITNTLYGSAFMLTKKNPTARLLAYADYQTFEHAMTMGHPCFVANNGRVGFDTEDYRQYAPEADQPVKLLWLAGHTSRTAYNAIDALPYHALLEKELGSTVIQSFKDVLASKDLEPGDYYFIPVHPWQWYNKLAIIFAPDIAAGYLVCLGYGPDDYKAQQSIRTFYNISHPRKFYTKTALSVLNMGFVRGLSPYYMDSTPSITTWIKTVIGEDPYLQKLGFTLLCEVATVGYRNLYFEPFGKTSTYNKMLAGLWRESPASMVEPGQQLMTMAALLHRDSQGAALLPELIAASGVETEVWLKRYLRCYLTPLLHCFYEYDLVFMPHGENLILVMEDHVPVKAIMKDITEEIALFTADTSLPEKTRRICVKVPVELRLLSIFTDVFDCFFRFLVQVLVEHCNYQEDRFWRLVAECIHQYQEENAHLANKFKLYDLFAPEFALSCLNRLQLRNHKQMLDLSDPAGGLQLMGTLKNPIAHFRNYNCRNRKV